MKFKFSIQKAPTATNLHKRGVIHHPTNTPGPGFTDESDPLEDQPAYQPPARVEDTEERQQREHGGTQADTEQ